MADADDQIQSDEEGGGKSGSKLPLIIIAFVVLLGGIGAAFYFLVLSGKSETESFQSTPRPTPGTMVQMAEAFTVNLPDGFSIATMKMVFEIETFPDADPILAEKEWMPISDDNKNTLYPKIRHTIMGILSSKTKAELLSSTGEKKAINDIITTLNQDVLSKSRLKNIYFVMKVVQ